MGYAYVKKRPVYFLGALYVLGTSQFQNTSSSCVRYKQCSLFSLLFPLCCNNNNKHKNLYCITVSNSSARLPYFPTKHV